MVSDTLTSPDVSVDELLDFAPQCCFVFVPADHIGWKPIPCEHPAAWSAATPCCGHVALVCDHHKECHVFMQCSPCKRIIDHLINWVRL